MNEVRAIRVLLVEDDPEDVLFVREFLSSALASARFEVLVAETLSAAMRELGRGAALDAVLLDLNLPDSRGIPTFLMARAQRSDLPIVVLTGLRDESAALEAVRLGAQDYLTKGDLDPKVLSRAILYAIERFRMVARLERLIASSPDGMIVVDNGLVVRYMNPAAEEIFGFEAEELLGRQFPHALEPHRTTEQSIECRDGKRKLVELRTTELEWRSDPAMLVTMRDVTELVGLRERVSKEAEAFEAHAALGVVSMELRTPLSTAVAAVDNLLEGAAGPLTPAQSEAAEAARRALARLHRLVHEKLDPLQLGRPLRGEPGGL